MSIAKHDQSGNKRKAAAARERWALRLPEIMRRLAAGETQAEIARTYRVAQYTLSKALRAYR